MRSSMRLACAILAVSLMWPVASSRGAVLLLGGQGGTEDPPETTEGAETEEDWNPTVTCSVAPPQTIWDLLDCLLNEISNPPPPCNPITTYDPPLHVIEDEPYEVEVVLEPQPPGQGDCYPYPQDREDFTVTLVPVPRYGVEIRRKDDGGEIERISLRENDPGIQTTELQMDPREGRFARIGQIDESPQGGGLYLTVNEERLALPTRPGLTAVELTGTLVSTLRSRGFQVSYESPYFYVQQREGIYRVQLRSTDPGITMSDLSLFPAEYLPETLREPDLPQPEPDLVSVDDEPSPVPPAGR